MSIRPHRFESRIGLRVAYSFWPFACTCITYRAKDRLSLPRVWQFLFASPFPLQLRGETRTGFF